MNITNVKNYSFFLPSWVRKFLWLVNLLSNRIVRYRNGNIDITDITDIHGNHPWKYLIKLYNVFLRAELLSISSLSSLIKQETIAEFSVLGLFGVIVEMQDGFANIRYQLKNKTFWQTVWKKLYPYLKCLWAHFVKERQGNSGSCWRIQGT